MVEELPAHGADEAFCRPVLPGTLERRALGMETETLDHLSDRGAEDRVVVVDQESMDRPIGKGVAEPLAHPPSRHCAEVGQPSGRSAKLSSPSCTLAPLLDRKEAHGGA